MASPARALIDRFESRFQKSPDLYRAPGRVNLIGEHTDYTGGLVLPIATDLACFAASAPNRDGVLRVASENMQEEREWPISRLLSLQPASDWTDYIIGVARQLNLTRGYNVVLHSTVPLGSGLSSSAAVEVATALALGWPGELPSLKLAQLCRAAENTFIGLPSGIMDQYVSIFGRARSAILIDCRSLEHEAVGLPADIAIVAVNSMVKHALGQSAYRERVAECRQAAQALGKELRDATPEDLGSIHDSVVLRRARHVISENERVLAFVRASRDGDLAAMGRLLIESHRSLQCDYEVSCEELDFLVEAAMNIPGVWGARMTGGGFGGCTVNLMQPSALQRFENEIRAAYAKRFGIVPECYAIQPSEGASRLS